MVAPFAAAPPPEISLAPAALPNYALRTTLRMLLALGVSLVFTFTYGTLAAKNRRAEMVLVPLLDVLQSVPVLGYLSFTAVFFVSLAPNRALGAELAAIFAIFHQPGLEHGLQLLPVPALRSARSRRSEPRLSLFRLALFREHLLRFCAHNRPHLSRAARAKARGAPKMRFEAELEDHLTCREAERTQRAVTAWGRYAKLLAYDDGSHTLSAITKAE